MRIFLLLTFFFFVGPPLGVSGSARADETVPATAYFPVLPFDAPADAEPQLVPLAANHPLEGIHAGLTRAIVVVHDESRDANAALAVISALAGSQNAATIILAPQFLLPSDIVRFADYLPDRGRGFAAWQVLGWSSGDDSMPVPSTKSVSSFTVMDLLLMYLSDRNAFPDLKEIVIAGFGAGANFIQRYAAFSAAYGAVSRQNIGLRYVLASPSSYLYLTASRPLGGKNGFGLPDASACPSVNDYPYGLEKLNAYGRRAGANAAKEDYATRSITYLSAEGKNPNTFLDTTCAALMQGADSASRAENYRLYLHTLYGDVAERTQIFAKTREGANDAVTLFGSACGMSALFGDGLCPPSEGGIR
jgi:hypothetical protein